MDNLLYIIAEKNHNAENLKGILNSHPEIKFVSLVGIDLSGNDTDEKIRGSLFLDDIDTFLNGVAVQTDGSSVVLSGIATLDDAKVDIVTDLDCRCPVDSRHILTSAVSTFKENLMNIFTNHAETLKSFDITVDNIHEIVITSATELEFWVKTPNNVAQIEELSTSQVLHEHYWPRTNGSVRNLFI